MFAMYPYALLEARICADLRRRHQAYADEPWRLLELAEATNKDEPYQARVDQIRA